MRFVIFAVLSLALTTLSFSGEIECELEDWTLRKSTILKIKMVLLQGSTTCERGMIHIRMYDEKGAYIGNATADIIGYAFNAGGWPAGDLPENMQIKYSFTAGYF